MDVYANKSTRRDLYELRVSAMFRRIAVHVVIACVAMPSLKNVAGMV